MIFTATPLISNAILSHDIKPDDGDIVNLLLPFVYLENKETPLFNLSCFMIEIYRAFVHATLNFFIMIQVIHYPAEDGKIPDMGSLSIFLISNLMIVRNNFILIN